MRSFFIFSSLLFVGAAAVAQTPAEPMPEGKPSSAAESFEPLPLMPVTPQSTAKPDFDSPESIRSTVAELRERAQKPTETRQIAEKEQLRLKFRQALIRAAKDPAVQSEWDHAEAAKTDPERRYALKQYYSLLYSRVKKLDKSVADLADERQKEAFENLEQKKIRQSVWVPGQP